MGAKISGKLVKPNTKGRTLKYFFAHEVWDFFERVMPAFIDKDITIEIYERKTSIPRRGRRNRIVVEIGTRLQKRLAKCQLPPCREEGSATRAKESKPKKAGKRKA